MFYRKQNKSESFIPIGLEKEALLLLRIIPIARYIIAILFPI
jgi:hypothetical protein